MSKDVPPRAPGVRARVRAELTAEIKASARRQLAVDGAASLSLRAIARELDMASSAIYRYFASRDDLLTALIVDAYDAVGVVVEQVDAGIARDLCHERFVAIANAIRAWAHENPHEYALIYGSPVPGYTAPDDTIDPATRVPVALISVLVDHYQSSTAATERAATSKAGGGDAVASTTDDALSASLAQILDFIDYQVPASTLARGLQSWGEVFGLISLELFGHFNNAVSDPETFFELSMVSLAERTLGP